MGFKTLTLLCAVSNAAASASVVKRQTRPGGEFHYGAAFGEPFDTSTACGDINLISPELFMNWGPDNRHDATVNVCDNSNIKFMPNLWGRDFDYPQLSALPNEVVPWGVMLENEPNWWGGDNGQDHGAGCNMTAQVAAERYYPNTDLINSKWGVGVVKLFTPSPVNPTYPACDGPQPQYGCTWQNQLDWLDEYFSHCPNCLQDAWAINAHEYSCNIETTKINIQRVWDKYGNKNIFMGELGCDGPSPEEQAAYLTAFAEWAYTQPNLVGLIWAGLNSVGSKGAQLVLDGGLTPVGQAFKDIQLRFPPRDTP